MRMPAPVAIPARRRGTWFIQKRTIALPVSMRLEFPAYRAFDAGALLEDLKSLGVEDGNASASDDGLKVIYELSQGIFLTEDTLEEWPALDLFECTDTGIANIEIDGIPILLEYPSGPFKDLYRDYFRNCTASTRPSHCRLSAQHSENGWAIYVNGREFLPLQHEQQVGLGLMHAARSLLYAQGDYDVAFHAAMVAHDDCGIMLCAPRECGKSTLAAYLVAQEFDLLTDEPALLCLDTWSLKPFRLPISLKQGSWPVLLPIWPQLGTEPIHTRSDGKKICLAHPSEQRFSSRPRRLTQIVFPQYRPSSVAQVEPLSPLHTLRFLSEGGMLLAKHFTRDNFETYCNRFA